MTDHRTLPRTSRKSLPQESTYCKSECPHNNVSGYCPNPKVYSQLKDSGCAKMKPKQIIELLELR